jgi:WD40 repeat protein
MDMNTFQSLPPIIHDSWILYSPEISPDSSKILTAADDKTIKIIDANTGIALHTIPHTAKLKSAVFSPDSLKIATITVNANLKIVEFNGKWIEHTITIKGEPSSSRLTFSPDSTIIGALSKDNDRYAITTVDTNNYTILYMLYYPNHDSCAIFSPDSTRMVTSSEQSCEGARIIDAHSGNLISTIAEPGNLTKALFLPHGYTLILLFENVGASRYFCKIITEVPASTLEQALFLQVLLLIKNQGSTPTWPPNNWGHKIKETFSSAEQENIARYFNIPNPPPRRSRLLPFDWE